MCQPPSDEAAKVMLGPTLSPDTTIEKVQLAPSVRPQRIYEVTLSNGEILHLVLPPLSMWRPLRSEFGMLASETTAVRWISETLARLQETTIFTSRQQQQKQNKEGQPSTPLKSDFASSSTASLLMPLLPTFLHYGQQKNHLPETSFAIYKPVRGTPLSLLSPTPPVVSQQGIDFQLGTIVRSLATLTSPTGRFGPLAAVLGTTTPAIATTSIATTGSSSGSSNPKTTQGKLVTGARPKKQILLEGGLSATGGAGTWSVAFHSMLEGVLRDGEDMAVVMAYSTIRRHFRRLGYLLDGVSVGRLVVVEAGGRGNVLVLEGEDEEEGRGRGGRRGKGGWKRRRRTRRGERGGRRNKSGRRRGK